MSANELFTRTDLKVATLEETVVGIKSTLERFEKRFDKLDEEINSVKKDGESNFRTIVLLIILNILLPLVLKYLT